jgi:serine/threonine-protein kinase
MWPTRFTLTVTNGESKGEEYVFHGPARCEVGRASDCDIALPATVLNQDVSRHHCAFEFDPPSIRVRDLGSLNGTYVNGEMIGQRPNQWVRGTSKGVRELRDGDEVQVGGIILRVRIDVLHTVPPELAEAN